MTIRYLIAAALMASACAAHADVIPASGTIVNGSNVAGAVGDSSVIAGVSRAAGSDALVQALYEKVSASVGSDMKVSLRQGIDGVYVTGLSTAKAAALAGDGMSVISTADGFKIVSSSPSGGSPAASVGGGAAVGGGGSTGSTGSSGNAGNSGVISAPDSSVNNGIGQLPGAGLGLGTGNGGGNGNNTGNGQGNGLGNASPDAVAVPEPSSIALMLAGMLGVAGLGRRRAR